MAVQNKKTKLFFNILFAAFIIVVLFTPLGNSFKVWLNRLIAMSPTVEKVQDQQQVKFGDWQLIDEKGNAVDFKNIEGKVIIINFWATWCPPCIAEKPSFQELYNDYKDKVVFMFITNDSPDKVMAFKEKNNYSLPVYYSQNTPPALLYSTSLPASYVIDKKGNIVVKKFRAADWNSSKFRVALDQLLQK